ncbi:hypothetical protein HDV62DRAFT_1891 [Trichoderma sp. SZMC 28011]
MLPRGLGRMSLLTICHPHGTNQGKITGFSKPCRFDLDATMMNKSDTQTGRKCPIRSHCVSYTPTPYSAGKYPRLSLPELGYADGAKGRVWLESGYRTADKSRISLSYRRILYIHYYAGEDYKGVMVCGRSLFFASAIIRSFLLGFFTLVWFLISSCLFLVAEEKRERQEE